MMENMARFWVKRQFSIDSEGRVGFISYLAVIKIEA